MRIAIASDHGGIELKKELIEYLSFRNEVLDLSPENDPNDDYPDFAYKVGKSLQRKESDFGILICRSGIGMSIAANKVKGVYCAKIDTLEEARLSREHNGCNAIAINGTIRTELAQEIARTYIHAVALNDERHQRRYDKIIKIENGEYNEL